MKCSKCGKEVKSISIVRGFASCDDCYIKYKADNKSKTRKYTRMEIFKVGDIVAPNNELDSALTFKIIRINKCTCWVELIKADSEKLGEVLASNDIDLRWVELIGKLKKLHSTFKNVRYNILKKQ